MMLRNTTKQVLNALLVVIAIVAMGLNTASAQSDQCNVKRDVGGKALDEITWKRLNGVYEDVAEEKYDEAYGVLKNMLDRAGRDTYLQAVLNQALAQVEWSRENYDASLAYFERAVELDTLPDQAHFTLMYQIAQLYFMKERYDEALEKLALWFCKVPEEEITSAAYVLQASMFAQKKDYAGALKAIDKAIAMDAEPQESWFQLKLGAHYELEQFPQVAETLETMISLWPDTKIYWVQLSQIYYRLKQEDRSLAVQALAYLNGLLDKQTELVYLSSLYSNAEVPYKAAEVLDVGIQDGIIEPTKHYWTIVAESWYAAEELEKSLVAYEQAGKAASDGDIDLRRGYILVDMERWPAALEALNLALEKGGLDERKIGEAYLLRGMAQFNLGNLEGASSDWGKAGRYDKTRDAARQWMNHLQEERRRRAS
jgi:tetratricopeptide (TPR) repeat protein